jgi:hypothetical protein
MTCIAMTLALSACGSDGENAVGGESGPSATTRVVHDPPLGVPDTPTFTLDTDEASIAYSADGAGYALSEGNIHKRDLASGEVVWRTAIDGLAKTSTTVGRELDDDWRRQTPLGTIAGEPSLAFTYQKVVEGTGTEGDIDEERVAVISAKTGAVRWDVKMPETGKTSHDRAGARTVLVAGITDEAVVIANDWDSDEGVGTAVLDGADGSVLWERPGVMGSVATDGMVVARQEDRTFRPKAWVFGLSARTGTEVWATAKDGMPDVPYSAGPGLVQFVGMDEAVYQNALVDIRTGREKAVAPGRCLYDEQSLLVCEGLGKELAGYRQETLEKLWSIKKSGEQGARVVPDLITTWHGAVYTSVGKATVVLDGTTGEDKVADLGVVPTVVVSGFIIAGSRVLAADE